MNTLALQSSSPRRPRTARWNASAALAGVLAATLAPAAHAAAIPFNEASTYSYNPNATGIGGAPGAPTDYLNTITTNGTTATSNYSQSGTWGNVSGTASADLSTGQLKMQASATDGGTGAYPYMQSNAIFGDSFTTTTAGGTPFTWANNTATFNMSLGGMLTSSDSFANLNAGAFVVLAILDKGTLDPNKPLIGGSNAIQYFLWDIGNPTLQVYYTDQQGNSTALQITGGYDTIPATLSATFAPGGDFDWALLLGASGQPTAGGSFNIDMAHTLTLSYQGPAGGVTTSDSGLFTNITQAGASVPEPAPMALLATGLLALGLLRTRRRVVATQVA